MASNRRGAFFYPAPPKKDSSLMKQLRIINQMASENNKKCLKAIGRLTSIIKKIYDLSYHEPDGYSRKLSDEEINKLNEVIAGLKAKTGLKMEQVITKNDNRLHSRVCLLEAIYVARRCHVQQALGLYRDLEKKHPRYQAAYDSHIRLLENLDHHDEAFRIMQKKEINCAKPLAESKRAPGAERSAILSWNGANLFSANKLAKTVENQQTEQSENFFPSIGMLMNSNAGSKI